MSTRRKRLDLDALDAAMSAKRATNKLGPLGLFANDPVRFATRVLGMKPWARQCDVLRAIAEHDRIAVRAGHKVGKSATMACSALWFLCTRPGARVVLVAPTARQIRSIVWRELRALHRNAVKPLGGEMHETPDRGYELPDGREIIGIATDAAERIAGFSGANVLIIVDEASGVSEDLFEAISGNLAGGGKLLICGNPTRTSGTFYDAFNRRAEFWHPLHISSLETPNATGGERIPGLATAKWCREMLAEWGESSALYHVRVLGEFPAQAENCIIPLGLVEESVARWKEAPRSGAAFDALGRLEIGVDPARFGSDETVIIARRGAVALEPKIYRHLDGPQVAARVVEIAQSLQRYDEKPIVRVDSIGIGASVVDALKANPAVKTIPVCVSESASNPTYQRMRDETWFRLRDWLRAGGCLPADPKLEGDLVAPTYSFSSSGRIQVESKDSMRARIKRSPDRADALCLAVYDVGATLARLVPTSIERGPFARPIKNAGPTDTWGRPLSVAA